MPSNPKAPIAPIIYPPSTNQSLVYPVNTLDSFSAMNKIPSWYNTTRAMTHLFDVFTSKYC
jgi:hypothetical protein